MASAPRRLGLLTGGGDCPGLTAVIRAASHRCARLGVELIGYRNGWEGVIEGSSVVLDRSAVKGILPLGGTILGTSRTDPLMVPDGVARIRRTLEADAVEGLIVVGGDGTLSAALELAEQGIRVVGVPKTIDNDLGGTDFTGFDGGRDRDRGDRPAAHHGRAHNRVIVVEVMAATLG